jgi:hypothetical protein
MPVIHFLIWLLLPHGPDLTLPQFIGMWLFLGIPLVVMGLFAMLPYKS